MISSTYQRERIKEDVPKISREGRRKQQLHVSATGKKNLLKRKKYSEHQVKYLRKLYDQLGGKWNGKMRWKTMEKTGLSRP